MNNTSHTVTIRLASDADAGALERLAQLDSVVLPPPPYLVAEQSGAVVAARSLTSHQDLADPFVRTRTTRELLALQARAA